MKEYKKENIYVQWNKIKCIHSANCATGLPLVFQPKESPWVKVENADKNEIIAQVAKCPSGALSIRKEDE